MSEFPYWNRPPLTEEEKQELQAGFDALYNSCVRVDFVAGILPDDDEDE